MKFLKTFIPALIIASLPLTNVFGISVTINAQKLKVSNEPVIENGTTLVPMRSIFEGLGMTLNWDDSTKTATATDNKTEIKLTLGSNIAYINGVATNLSVPAKSINGSTMVPVRFISEALGNTIEWNGEDQAVNVYSFDLSQLAANDQKYLRIKSTYVNKIHNINLKNSKKNDVNSITTSIKKIISTTDNTISQMESLKLENSNLENERVQVISSLKSISSNSKKLLKAIQTNDINMFNEAVSQLDTINL